MFIGREKELVLLQQDYIGKAVMVYGKRRVGKTTLIQKALDNCPYQTVYFECLKGTVQENIDSLVDELVRAKILPVALSFSTLQDVFTYLNTLPQKMAVVIDEYPYLKVMNEPTTVDSVFQSIIDNRLGNIELILSGSHIGMMKDLLQEKNALYGRFAVTIKLNELNYLDTAKFYPDKTPYDKVAHYAVFGGSPFVNQALRPTATLRENIVSTILNPVSAVYLYASQLLLSDYSVKINAERIFAVIGNGKKRYSEIEDKLDVKKTGNLAKQMKPLRDLEIISRNYPINKLNDSKKSTFEINDNLLRFYFTFIYKNASALQVLGAEAFYDEYAVKSITTGALEQQRYIEKLVHGNKNREAKYQESVSLEPPAMTSFLSVLTFLKASTRYRIPFSGTRRPRNNMYESFFSPNLSVIRLASRICGLFTPLGIKCVSLP